MTGKPDWGAGDTPSFEVHTVTNVGSATTKTLYTSSAPFRLWKAWMSGALGTLSTFAGSVFARIPVIQDTTGSIYLALSLMPIAGTSVGQVNDFDYEGLAINPGGTPLSLELVTDAGVVNEFLNCNGGVVISSP